MTETKMSSPTIACPWCRGDILVSSKVCSHCFMPIENASDSKESSSQETSPVVKPKPKKKVERSTSKNEPTEAVLTIQELIHNSRTQGFPIAVGIDPGARYVGFSIRNKDDVFMSSTFRRPDEIAEAVDWAKEVVKIVKEVLKDIEYDVMGIEGTTDPKGFKKGKQDSLNPRDIIRTATVVGALAIAYDEAHIIRPRGNGDKPQEYYPKALFGVRPKTLLGRKDEGVKVRNHERSAFDVAGHALFNLLHQDSA